MATATDYTGRTIDLSIFIGAQPTGEELLVLDFTPGGNVITGVEKMVQTYTLLFLTEQGTVEYYPTLGTPFITAVRKGFINNESDVKNQFNLAAELIRQTMDLAADAASPSLPPDEIYESSELMSFSLDKAASLLTMQIKVNSQAGSSRAVILPVPLAIQ